MVSIGIVVHNLGLGGTQNVVRTLSTAFEENGCVVTIYTYKKYDGMDVLDNCRNYGSVEEVKTAILASSHDVILLNSYEAYKAFSNVADQRIFNVIHLDYSEHVRWYQIDKKIRFRKIFNGKNNICVSNGIKKGLGRLWINTNNINVIHNPVDVSGITKRSLEESPDFGKYVCWVGRFVDRKRPLDAIEVISKLDKKINLVMVGDGDQLSAAKERAEFLGVSSRVFFVGFQKNPMPYIRHSEALLFTSSLEGFGLVLIEAMALGVSVVSSDCPSGPEEILIGDLARQLVPVGDIKTMTETLKKTLINKDRDAFIRRASDFSSKIIADKYLSIFKK